MEQQKDHITLRLTPQNYCRNCDGIVYSKYCSECGQRHHEGRLSFGILFEEMLAKLFELDSGIVRTMMGVYKPGIVIREYVDGKRKKYVKPVNFYLLLLALYLFFYSYINPYPEPDLLIEQRGMEASFSRSISWFSQQLKLIQILSIPLYAFYTLNAFKKYEYNYFEHISMWLYIGAYSNIVAIITILLSFLYSQFFIFSISDIFNLSLAISTIYGLYGLMQTFKLYTFKGLLKVIWTMMYCFFMVVLLITLGVSLILTIIDLYFINPVL